MALMNPDAPGPEQSLDRLRTLLRKILQLDRGDLDFGLYRIMNLKSAEIVSFLDNDLLPQVKETLKLTSDTAGGGKRHAVGQRLCGVHAAVRSSDLEARPNELTRG